MSVGLSSAEAGGVAASVIIAFVGCVIAQCIGIVCYKKGVCKNSTPRPTVGSITMNSGYHVTTAPQISLNGTHVLYQQPQRPYQPQHPATLTLEEPPHLKEATTHAGEAPPAYHAAALYQTMTLEDYKSLKLSEASADNGAKADLSSNADAPPSYSEIISSQEDNSVTVEVECDQNGNICNTAV